MFLLPHVALLSTTVLSLGSCRDDTKPTTSPVAGTQAPADTLATKPLPVKEQRLGNSDFYLTLPPGFALKATDAADFLVYYFAPADTTVRADFTGGLYLGNQPQGDERDTVGGCRIRRATTTLLGHPATFSIRRCATGYTINSVFDSYSGRGWDAQANAFGEAKSAAGLRQLLTVFATLRQQKQSAK
jgi:hypothetical protein